MANRPATIRQADVKRLVKGALAGGFDIGKVEIEGGKIVMHGRQAMNITAETALDQWRQRMVRAKIKGVNTVRKVLADGSVRRYYYHRSTGKPLPGKPGDPIFVAALAAAEKEFSERHRGTFNQLSHLYTISAEFQKLAESTRKEYGRMLGKAELRFGSMPIAALEDPRVRQDFMKWHAEIAVSSGHREADNRLTIVSAMLEWGRDKGYVTSNHLTGFRRLYSGGDRSEMIWLPEHIDAFMKVAPVEMQQALILALHTGQRQGDLLRASWSNYDGRYLTVRQEKSRFKTKVEIPCTAALKAMLDGMSRIGAVILTTKTDSRGRRAISSVSGSSRRRRPASRICTSMTCAARP